MEEVKMSIWVRRGYQVAICGFPIIPRSSFDSDPVSGANGMRTAVAKTMGAEFNYALIPSVINREGVKLAEPFRR